MALGHCPGPHLPLPRHPNALGWGCARLQGWSRRDAGLAGASLSADVPLNLIVEHMFFAVKGWIGGGCGSDFRNRDSVSARHPRNHSGLIRLLALRLPCWDVSNMNIHGNYENLNRTHWRYQPSLFPPAPGRAQSPCPTSQCWERDGGAVMRRRVGAQGDRGAWPPLMPSPAGGGVSLGGEGDQRGMR